jgi:O-antigen/teichoic acid export membrane protein/aminoglycoside phosphotransferase
VIPLRPDTAPAAPAALGPVLRWLRGWASPVHRDGLALILSAGLTSVLGLLFWVLAARLYPPAVVGLNSVALSSMMLLGQLALLNLNYVLLRFLPVAGGRARRFVLGAYLVSGTASALAAAMFVLGAQLWAPALLEHAGRGQLLAFLVPATVVWTIFLLQDFVLTAVMRATVVPVENAVFSVLKIALLVAAVTTLQQDGVAASWVAATAVVVVATNAYLFLRALPAHEAATRAGTPLSLAGTGRFVAADYAGATFWSAVTLGLPMLVIALVGPVGAAVYGIAWTIAFSLYLVSSSMGQSLVAHLATDPDGAPRARRSMEIRALTLLLPAVVVLAVAARPVLGLFGEDYAQLGTGVLILACLSSLPNIVTTATVSVARVQRRLPVLVAVPASISVLTIALSLLLLPRWGVTGVGAAWLVSQTLVAGAIVVLRAAWLPGPLDGLIGGVRGNSLLRRVTREGRDVVFRDGRADWHVAELLHGASDAVVVGIGPDRGPGAVLKVGSTAPSRALLLHEHETLRALQADARLGGWRDLLPKVLDTAEVGTARFSLESRLPGRSGLEALVDPRRADAFTANAIAAISELHRRTASAVSVDERLVAHWVGAPATCVRGVVGRGAQAAVARIEHELGQRLHGRTLPIGWTHGDFCAVNALVHDDGAVAGIVDWGQADPQGFPVIDVVIFQLLSEMTRTGREVGPIVLDRLARGRACDGELVRAQRDLGNDPVDAGTLVLLGWLQHVATNLAKAPKFAANPVWMRRNVMSVLRALPHSPSDPAVSRTS